MPDRRAFLTARWTNLALITYEIDPALLRSHISPGCELDKIDGHAFVSLVAFDFLDTRVLGVKWPLFVNFPEINLRFYVRQNGKRGVAFIRELVPSKIVATIARVVYNEPYLAIPMRSAIERAGNRITTSHIVKFAGREQFITVSASDELFRPPEDTREHFFKEHSWGFGTSRRGELVTYEVNHPRWDIYRDPKIERLDWDFAGIYGQRWKFLREAKPVSVIFAAGSEVSVYPTGTTVTSRSV